MKKLSSMIFIALSLFFSMSVSAFEGAVADKSFVDSELLISVIPESQPIDIQIDSGADPTLIRTINFGIDQSYEPLRNLDDFLTQDAFEQALAVMQNKNCDRHRS